MKKNKNPDALVVSPAMAITDAIPVILFIVSAVLIALIFKSVLFCAGAALCILAGLGKVAWKLIKAFSEKDIRLLFVQMRVLMPIGFLLIIISLFVDNADFSAVWKNITDFPCVIFFSLGFAGIVAMSVLAVVTDPGSRCANITEQAVNSMAQLCFLLGIIIIWYSSDSYKADDFVKECIANTETVTVSQTDTGIFFDGPGTEKALVFYPGAKVEYIAYSPLMRKIAEEGIDCFLCEMPYNLAVFGINTADKIIENYSYNKWYIGGHSLGGAMASAYANGREDISGLVLMGAYPTAQPDCPALIIYGSNDGVINRSKLEYGISFDGITVVEIPGGNHAQFGSYGDQAGDNKADITNEEQWDTTANAVSVFADKT